MKLYGEDNKSPTIFTNANFQFDLNTGVFDYRTNTLLMGSTQYNSTYAQLVIGLHDNAGNQLVIGQQSTYWRDHGHATTTDPTLFIHSDTDPATVATQWVSLTHNKTDAEFITGSGGIVQQAPPSAPTLTANSQLAFYLDEGGNNLKVTAKYSDGTAKTATIAFD
jgi:hypothetical protein